MADKSNAEVARDIVKKISDAAIELAFVRHELTTTDYEATEYADVEEGVEAFKELVEGVKADVVAVLTGDETGCLDPEDVDYDNESEWLRRQLTTAQSQLAKEVLAEIVQYKETFALVRGVEGEIIDVTCNQIDQRLKERNHG